VRLTLALTLAFACFACAGERAGDAAGQADGKKSAGVGTEVDHALGQVRASDSATGNVGQYRRSCRMQAHIFKEDMSKAEVKDFTSRIAYRVQANLNGGDDKNLGDILDDIDVPTYKGLCG
jgi:hypothetical protein